MYRSTFTLCQAMFKNLVLLYNPALVPFVLISTVGYVNINEIFWKKLTVSIVIFCPIWFLYGFSSRFTGGSWKRSSTKNGIYNRLPLSGIGSACCNPSVLGADLEDGSRTDVQLLRLHAHCGVCTSPTVMLNPLWGMAWVLGWCRSHNSHAKT